MNRFKGMLLKLYWRLRPSKRPETRIDVYGIEDIDHTIPREDAIIIEAGGVKYVTFKSEVMKAVYEARPHDQKKRP